MGCYSVKFVLITDISGQTIVRIFKDQEVVEELRLLVLMGFYLNQSVFAYRRFGKSNRPNLQVSSSQGSTVLGASDFTQILHYPPDLRILSTLPGSFRD